jgi:DNA invertase Pin-like site-specific DNA recombinase
LARSTLHLCQIAAELERKGVDLQALDQPVDTTSSTGRLLFNMLGAIAQFETEIRAERQMDGIQQAKARGVPFGRHKTLTPQHIAELCARRKAGVPISRLVHDFRISKATVYRYLAQAGPDLAGAADTSP